MKSAGNVYIKVGNKYKPLGITYDYLPDGIWYIRHTENSHKSTRSDYLEGIYKVGERPNPIDIPQLCRIEDYVEYVLESKEFNNIINNDRGLSFRELAGKIVYLVLELNKKYQEDVKK